MQILLALIWGACAGALAHYTMPGRDTRGPVLAPMLGAVVGGAVWTAATWAGLSVANPWIWVLGALVPPAAAFGTLAALTAARHAHDQRMRARLGISA